MELNSYTQEELREFFQSKGESAFRGNQLFSFFHRNKRTDYANSNLSKKCLSLLKSQKVTSVSIRKVFSSGVDETKKLLFALEDENVIEGVLMKYKHGYSQCVSTQVGCRMGCSFCASTKEGLLRNLTPAEMLLQVYEVEKAFQITVSNIILMGSGEPLDNYDNVLRFFLLLHDRAGHNISYRNMTLSTCGIVPNIIALAQEDIPVNLAVSLHATNNVERSCLLPVNRKYSLEKLKKALLFYQQKTSKRITFEYTLIEGKNDREENALELQQFAKGLMCHINLIPLNPIEEFQEERPQREKVIAFQKRLESLGLNATIRRELGSDINASCGQLRRNYKRGEKVEICSGNQCGKDSKK